MGRRMIEVRCQNPDCGKPHPKPLSEVTRSTKLGRGFYCSRSCSVTHANYVLGRIAVMEKRLCKVCRKEFEVLGKAKSRTTCNEDCADVLRYERMSPEAKERQKQSGRIENLIPPHETLKLREAWKYVAVRELLEEQGFLFEFEEPIGPYVVDLVLYGEKAIIEFDGPHHETAEVKEADVERDHYLLKHGWRVFRTPTTQAEVIPVEAITWVLDKLCGSTPGISTTA